MSALARRLIPMVKLISSTRPESRYGSLEKESVPKKKIGSKKIRNAKTRCTRFDRTTESGITAEGNLAFLTRARSNTIEGVDFVRESEKKFHRRSPTKRKK